MKIFKQVVIKSDFDENPDHPVQKQSCYSCSLLCNLYSILSNPPHVLSYVSITYNLLTKNEEILIESCLILVQSCMILIQPCIIIIQLVILIQSRAILNSPEQSWAIVSNPYAILMQSSCNQQCRLILIQLLHRQGSCSIQSVKILSEWASFVWTVFLKRYLFIFWRKIFNQLCLILCFFRRFVRRGFHIRLVKT